MDSADRCREVTRLRRACGTSGSARRPPTHRFTPYVPITSIFVCIYLRTIAFCLDKYTHPFVFRILESGVGSGEARPVFVELAEHLAQHVVHKRTISRHTYQSRPFMRVFIAEPLRFLQYSGFRCMDIGTLGSGVGGRDPSSSSLRNI